MKYTNEELKILELKSEAWDLREKKNSKFCTPKQDIVASYRIKQIRKEIEKLEK